MKKVDLFLRKSRNNDEFARMIRGRNRSDEDIESIIAKWRSCEHLFVKVREPEYIGAFHTSDCETIPARYECVRCGLTNRLVDTEEVIDRHGQISIPSKKRVTDETTEWRRQRPEVSDENLLGEEPIKTVHPGVLFYIAIELCLAQGIRASKQNLFRIMKELYDMETTIERFKISTVAHASALIERYKKKHGLYVDED